MDQAPYATEEETDLFWAIVRAQWKSFDARTTCFDFATRRGYTTIRHIRDNSGDVGVLALDAEGNTHYVGEVGYYGIVDVIGPSLGGDQ
jgi:hypothetical protein